jgi:diguanylate cyclase (GGDEF)-like protein
MIRAFILFILIISPFFPENIHSSQPSETGIVHSLHIQLTKEEKAWLVKHPTIIVGNETDYPPFDFALGDQPAGYSIDLLDLLAEKIGLHIEYVNGYTWKQLVDKFENNDLDLLHTLAKTPGREKIGLFSNPYMRLKNNFVTRRNLPDIYDIRQLYGKTAAVGKGWHTEEYLLQHHPEVQLLPVDGIEEMLDAVSRGEADATMAAGVVIRYNLKKLGLTDLKISGWFQELDIGKSNKYHFMAHHNAPELISMLNKAFDSLTPGDIEPLEKKWFGSSIENFEKISFTEEEKLFLQKHPVIKVANDSGWPPYDFFEQGEARGYSMDYLRILADIIGIKLVFIQDSSWDKLIQQFETKKLDIITTYEDSPQHHPYALFTDPFLNTQESIIIRQHTPFLKDYKDLYGKKVVIIKGYGYEEIIRKNHPEIQMVLVDMPVEGLKMISYGKADAMIENSAVATYLMRMNGIANLILAGDPTIPGIEVGDKLNIAIRKDWPPLHAIFAKAMQAVPESAITKLNQRWLEAAENEYIGVNLTEEEKAYLSKKGTIKFCACPNARPYEWINNKGNYDGIGADFLDLFEKRLDIEFELLPTQTREASLKNIRERKCDILPFSINRAILHDAMNFTNPYIVQPFVVVTRLEGEFVNNAEELRNRSIGIIKNQALTEFLKKKIPNFNAVEVKNTEDGLVKVQKKEIYGYIDSMPAVGYFMQKNAMTDLKIAGRLDADLELCIASRNDEPLLGQILQKAADGLGEREKTGIVGKWISVKYEKGTDYELIFKILAGVLVIIVMIAWWNRKLSKARKIADQLRLEAEVHKKQAEKKNKIALGALKSLEEKSLELERMAVTDRLTGLFNRVRLEEALNAEYEKAQRFSRGFGVIIIDVDDFKSVNDTYGHNVGDKVLVSFSNILKENTRAADTVGRWGGEEFLIVACETDLDGAVLLAEKLKAAIEAFDFPVIGKKTASFGVAVLKAGEEIKDLIARADQGLYSAKNSGRNRVGKMM